MIKLQQSLEYEKLPFKINYKDDLFFIGSCFTEHICSIFDKAHFNVLQNPSGIIFDSKSIHFAIQSYLSHKQITADDLFFFNDLFLSWHHHSVFSDTDKNKVVQNINIKCKQAYHFLSHTNCIFITIGSAFSYWLKDINQFVANCHKYPQNNFEKKLIKSTEIINDFKNIFKQIFSVNPNTKIILTISPVRHLRDGIVANNRSKANLIEATHYLVELFANRIFYLPIYEMMVDILRDYRFYDIDLVHPNYLATSILFETLIFTLFDEETKKYFNEAKQLYQAKHHIPLHKDSKPHQFFLKKLEEDLKNFDEKYKPKNKMSERTESNRHL